MIPAAKNALIFLVAGWSFFAVIEMNPIWFWDAFAEPEDPGHIALRVFAWGIIAVTLFFAWASWEPK